MAIIHGYMPFIDATNPQPSTIAHYMTNKKILYHATTQKKAKLYRQTGCIKAPVRGFSTLIAAMAWAMKCNRTVILAFEANRPYKLPDHHNKYGEAWWNDGDVELWRCEFSANGDA